MKKITLILLGLGFSLSLIAQDTSTQESTHLGQQNDSQNEKSLTIAQKKSGFVIGVEALFGSANTHWEGDNSGDQSLFSLMGGFYGGYQYYLDENLGIRALLAIHDGTPITGDFTIEGQKIQTSALPFWVGTELDVLWDFWQEGEHSIGISLGLGYNFETYWDRSVKVNGKSEKLQALFQHNLYPILGFHYYYGHHQMSLNYRFIGSLNQPIKEENIALSTGNIKIKTKYTFKDYLNFSYSYRF